MVMILAAGARSSAPTTLRSEGTSPVARKAKVSKEKTVKPADIKDAASSPDGKMKNKDHECELETLHVELVKLQQWVVTRG